MASPLQCSSAPTSVHAGDPSLIDPGRNDDSSGDGCDGDDDGLGAGPEKHTGHPGRATGRQWLARSNWRGLFAGGAPPDLATLAARFSLMQAYPVMGEEASEADSALDRLADQLPGILAAGAACPDSTVWSAGMAAILRACLRFKDALPPERSGGMKRFLLGLAREIGRTRTVRLEPAAMRDILHESGNVTADDCTEAILQAVADQMKRSPLWAETELSALAVAMLRQHPGQGADSLMQALAGHIRGSHRLAPETMRNLLFGLRHQQASTGSAAMLQNIVRHLWISEPLSGRMIGDMLYGLRNQAPGKGVDAVLIELTRHIRQTGPMSSREIGDTLYGLQRLPVSKGANMLLKALIPHIETCERMSPVDIGNAFYGLQRLAWSSSLAPILQALARHVDASRQLSAHDIAKALYALNRLPRTPLACGILCSLADQLGTLSKTALAAYKAPAIYQAEVLNSLTPWLKCERSSPPHQAALDVIYALSKNSPAPGGCLARLLGTDPSGGRNELTPQDMDEAIWQLLQGKVKPGLVVEYDFHGLSYDLAATFGRIAITRFQQAEGDRSIRVVFGAASHNPAKRGRMRAVARRLLERFDGLALVWKGPLVQIARKVSSSLLCFRK